MIQNLYTIFDNKAGAYLPPFNSINNATATRQFATAINDEAHDFHRNAPDYSLWWLGEFDQDSGKINSGITECIAQAHEILAQIQRETQIQ